MTKIDLLTQQLELLVESQNKLAQAMACCERAMGKERFIIEEIHDVMLLVADRIEILQMSIDDEINA